MIFVLYACLIAGAAVLLADIRGSFTVRSDQAGAWHRVGLVAAAAPGIGPLLGWITGSLSVSWPFPLIAIGYLLAFALLAIGLGPWAGPSAARFLRRAGYIGLLVLGALPSFVLLLFAPAILLAGAALVEARPAPRLT